MPEVTKENFEVVTNAFDEYLRYISDGKVIDVKYFVDFMEQKFFQAGYRDLPKIPRSHSAQTNILLIHDTSAGDLILMSPVIREIRRVYPHAKIKLLLSYVAENLAECCPHVDEIISFQDNKKIPDIKGYFEFAFQQAKNFLNERIDICYAFGHFAYTPLIMYMCGAKERICFLFNREKYGGGNTPFPLNNSMNIFATKSAPPFLYGSHHVDCNMSLLDFQLGAPVFDRHLEIWCDKEDVEIAKNIFQGRSGNFYALNMGGSAGCKKYPPQNYAAVVKMILQEEPEINFIILGGGDKDLESAKVFRESLGEEIFNKHFIDATDKLTYRQSALAVSHCKMYIGNDSGIMHAAAAVKCPVLAVFAFPADAPKHLFDTVRAYRPYKTPNVVIQPANALPECRNDIYSQYGCKMTDTPHCIAQIKPETVFKGFHLLKERTAKKMFETKYIA